MQRNEDILDDIDMEVPPTNTGTNRQLFRGFITGAIIQFFLWILFSEGLENIPFWMDKPIFEVESIGYKLNTIIPLVYSSMVFGALSFLILGNSKNQPYSKLLSIGFLFSNLAVFEIFIWRSISEWTPFTQAISDAFPMIFGVIFFYFVMLIGIILILKRKLWHIGFLFVTSGFILMGFIE